MPKISKKNVMVDVGAELCVQADALPYDMLQTLRQSLTRANPSYVQRERMGMYTKNIPSRVSMATVEDGVLRIPRGALTLLRSTARRFNVELMFDNHVTSSRGRTVGLDELPITLRAYQKQAVMRMLQRVQGYVTLPCGAGKTVLGCAAILACGESTIILVHTVDLAQQWSSTLLKLFKRKTRSSNSWAPLAPGEICVVMVQRLNKAGRGARTFLASAGCVVLDEAHHAPATTFRSIFQNTPARFRWGLTATPDRDDGWGWVLPIVLGPQLFGMTTRDLLEKGFLLEPTILPVRTDVGLDMEQHSTRGRFNMNSAVTALCEHEGRTQFLVRLAIKAASKGRSVLILVPRKRYAYVLKNEIQNSKLLFENSPVSKLKKKNQNSKLLSGGGTYGCVVLTGDVPKPEREDMLRSMRSGRSRIAIATQLADEGLDVPILDTLILAGGGRASGRTIQRVGRILRLHGDKQRPLVFDLVDPGPFESQFHARCRAYQDQLGILPLDPMTMARAVDALDRADGDGCITT